MRGIVHVESEYQVLHYRLESNKIRQQKFNFKTNTNAIERTGDVDLRVYMAHFFTHVTLLLAWLYLTCERQNGVDGI